MQELEDRDLFTEWKVTQIEPEKEILPEIQELTREQALEPYQPLINNLTRAWNNYNAATGSDLPIDELSLSLTEKLLLEMGDELFPDKIFMYGPVMECDDGVIVTAITRALKARFALELAQDLKIIYGDTAIEELRSILAAEVIYEIKREVESLKEQGMIMCPYVLLETVRGVDRNTFQPVIGFKTRYGVRPKPNAV